MEKSIVQIIGEEEDDDIEIIEIVKPKPKVDLPDFHKWTPSAFCSTRKVTKRPNSLNEWLDYSNSTHKKKESRKHNDLYSQRLSNIKKSYEAIQTEKLFSHVRNIAIFNLKTEGVINIQIRPKLENALHFFLLTFQNWCCSTGFFNQSLFYQDQYTKGRLENEKIQLKAILEEALDWVRSLKTFQNDNSIFLNNIP